MDDYDIEKTIVREHLKQESRTGKEFESVVSKLIKGMKDLRPEFTKLEKVENSSVKLKPNEGEKE